MYTRGIASQQLAQHKSEAALIQSFFLNILV